MVCFWWANGVPSFSLSKNFFSSLWSNSDHCNDNYLTIQYVALSNNCPAAEWTNRSPDLPSDLIGNWNMIICIFENVNMTMHFWECILCSDHWPIRIWLRILKIYSEDYVVCVSVAIPSSADWNVRINHGNEKCIIMLRLRMYFEFTIENVIVCFNPSEVRSLISWLEQNSRHRPKMPITIQFQFVNFLFATWKHCSSK